MSINPVTAMDVDSPSGTLKRCSSAPMINENSSGMTTTPPPSSSSREPTFSLLGSNNQQRTRRSSYSFSPVVGSPKLTPRINQLRQEECVDFNTRELAHEREIHHTMQISQSWEDLRLVQDSADHKPSKLMPLQLSLPSYSFHCNSPSPTRLTSPGCGFQSPTRASRTIIRRSASPVLRPSPLGVKRKLDDDKSDYHLSPTAKRFLTGDRCGLLTTSSPLPGSLSSVGTPESLSSADSPNFNFRMIDSPSPNRALPPEPMVVSKPDQEMSEGPS